MENDKFVIPKPSNNSGKSFAAAASDEDLFNQDNPPTQNERERTVSNKNKDKLNPDNSTLGAAKKIAFAQILTEEDIADMKKVKENPKFAMIIKHIDVLVDRTQKSRQELELLMQTSIEIKNQCKIQQEECRVLDNEQKRVSDEMGELRDRVHTLQAEKTVMERKLEELRLENDELEAFLADNAMPQEEDE
ncbi:hypothetical protein HK103_002135 [Boothiomyces macroporosus]|uniref:Uncharacterized protein n=1 Tax=Boothiomyces macroporosus TaxID=261099 RepID=A0AAD5UJ50_9FUNG|nr:hypothetical protein HK103_002135 [Boothiomyces macroporosus]